MKKLISILCLAAFMIIPLTSLAYTKPIDVHFITIDEYKTNQSGITLLDVRSTNSRERSKLTVPREIWINPKSGQALDSFVVTADKEKSYTVFCSCVDDNYSIRAAQLLTKNGFKHVSVLKGGWDEIIKSGIELSPIKGDQK